MTTRLYFLVDDEPAAKTLIDHLRGEGFDDADLQAVAHRERYPLQDMPEAGITDRTDFLPAARRGVALGGTTGLLAGLAAVALPAPGIVLAGGAMLGAFTAAGAAFGTWASTLVGIGVLHRDLKPFEEALEAGRVLVLVDTEDDDRTRAEALIRDQFPAITIESGELDDVEADTQIGSGA
ncbi:MAG TPA: hypothetical protein VLA56_19560 [Pseudomonadales bacterium]|nr:hypothetical protein [Pseudomonadales bacterium]